MDIITSQKMCTILLGWPIQLKTIDRDMSLLSRPKSTPCSSVCCVLVTPFHSSTIHFEMFLLNHHRGSYKYDYIYEYKYDT